MSILSGIEGLRFLTLLPYPRPFSGRRMSDHASVLIVDDTPENLRVLCDVLSDMDCRLLVANSGERALEIIQRSQPDLILLDVMMPGMDGFETCRRIRNHPDTRELPVLFVTALAEEVQAGFGAGGNDFIAKPINTAEVRARVAHHLEKQALLKTLRQLNHSLEEKVRQRTADLTILNRQLREEVNERRFMQDRLNYLARHDFVTQLYNRDALHQHVSLLLADIQHQRSHASFILLDVDEFRLVNESCGCIAGDELLHQFGQTIAPLLNPAQEFFARLGGDKFAIVVKDSSPLYLDSLITQIQTQLNQFDFHWESRIFPITATITAIPIADTMTHFEQVMMMVDELAYSMKKSGRKTRIIYNASELSHEDRRIHLNWGLRILDGLKQDLFELHYQYLFPLSGPTTDTPGKMEMLVRLRDPETRQLLLPGDFIRAAERFNIVSKIDRWVIHNTLKVLAEQPQRFAQAHHISLNLSALSVREEGFVDFILEQIQQFDIDGSRLCFEVTETEALNNFQHTRYFMNQLHQVGAKIALDDFGTGFSSFAYLMELPFDLIKIDGMFVRDMDVNPVHKSMIRSIIELAKTLNKPIVAEFVENQNIVKELQALDVEWGQGYHLHKPEKL